MNGIKGLAHIGIRVKNIEQSIDFYKRLGFTLDKEVSIHVRIAFMSAGTCLIELVETKPEADCAGIIDHIAIEVCGIEDVVASCKTNGIAIDETTIRTIELSGLGGVKNVFFAGPDGERLEFFEHLDDKETLA